MANNKERQKADDDPLRLALRASVELPESVARARDDFLATHLGRDDLDLTAAWQSHAPGAEGRAAAVAMLARRGLVCASLTEIACDLPRGLAGVLVESGRWTPRMALALSRTPHGGFAPETLASLAPWLDAAQAREALAIVAAQPGIYDIEDAQGVATVVTRLVALEGPEAAEPALAPFSRAIRALVAAVSWHAWPRELHLLAARCVAEGAHEVSHCSHAAGTAFAALPLFEEPARSEIVRRAMDRLYDEDFGLDCEHAALLGAVGLWTYGWEEGSRDTLPYPRAQMLAHVVPYLPPERRAEAYALWLDAYRAALPEHPFGLVIPKRLPGATFDAVLALARHAAHLEGRARALVQLAYQSPELVPEARVAVEALSGAHAAVARLSLLPVVGEADRARLADESHDAMLALLAADQEKELHDASASWPRGPDERLWCYLSGYRRSRALLVAPLAWMPPAERSRRAGARLTRSSLGGDCAILALAAAALGSAPEPARRAWIERLATRAQERETHPVALVAIAALLPDPARAALAEFAWRAPRLGTDEEGTTGHALARASRWIDAARRAPLQLEALERWSAPPHPYQWTALVEALRDSLEPEAVEWVRAHASSTHTTLAILPVLPERARRLEASACLERVLQGPFYWQHTGELKQLYLHASNAGARALGAIDRWREIGMHCEEEEVSLAVAWALDPLSAAGERERAEALRCELRRPLAECVADLAIARHEVEGPARDARIAAALTRLGEITSHARAYEAWEAALRWLAPGPHRRRALAIAEALDGDAWLTFARTAQQLGAREELAAQLDEARAATMTPEALLASGLDLALWAHRLDAAQAFACWRQLWRETSTRPRSKMILGWGAPRQLEELIELAVRAGGPAAAAQIAETVLDVADWFP